MNHDDMNRLGAVVDSSGRTCFRVWAPRSPRVQLQIASANGDVARSLDMSPEADGYHSLLLTDAPAGTRYRYRLEGDLYRPDPASRLQSAPGGVHGWSEVVDSSFAWSTATWINPPLSQHVIYELHVGTFTPRGTFDAMIERLDDLIALGISTIELMPIAEFPGSRNWGYDGTCLFAAHRAYGGPIELKRFVNACHAKGLAVFLDVVYNHLGPEGNYLNDFGPYFTDRYRTPWGAALNFDGEESDHVRRFFVENALYWVDECRIDGLRLDAVHAIRDHTARTFLEELTDAVHAAGTQSGRRIYVIAESADNDPRLVQPAERGGLGMDATWSDDFHHALRVSLTGERNGYFADYRPVTDLAKVFMHGFAYTGQRSAYRKRRHGRSASGLHGSHFVVCAQNHDQIGNRMVGDRLQAQAGLDGCRIAAALTLLSPFVPLLFMGEEYAEVSPFQYFVSHGDAALVEAVRQGRREEFASFAWVGEVPDPQDPATFERSKLNWSLRSQSAHAGMLAYYQRLLELRRLFAVFSCGDLKQISVATHSSSQAMLICREIEDDAAILVVNFEPKPVEFSAVNLPCGDGEWKVEIDSTDAAWGGGGSFAEPRIQPNVKPILAPARCVAAYRRTRKGI